MRKPAMIFVASLALSACAQFAYTKGDMATYNQDHSTCDFEGVKARSSVTQTNNGFMDGYNKGSAYRDVYGACMRMKGYSLTRM